ncbi:cytochrome P460 family protein [Allomuricauda sp. F6463D]|uniref:cytochrome P460 family protein n=1 Tax=Allomuricauda sp. F6463D TaxID=2926409 RepID=UPI001FF4F3F3|nr:cytochrome P460 family protein [Muricauda sp. F6463D]MCK0160516.1 heme-binding domain-containing protein [Muricauda sp. F6463D]
MNKKVSGYILLLIFLIGLSILGSQFRNVVVNPPITSDFGDTPENIKNIVRNSCYDCHSNETRLKWFHKLPIIANMVKADVEKGRQHINFSEWDTYSEKEQVTILFNMLTKVKKDIMPPKEYVFVHPEAKLTQNQEEELETYIKGLNNFASNTGNAEYKERYEKQYERWEKNKEKEKKIEKSPNGIPFPEDYRNWKVVSSSFRVDHNSLRVILGNDIAIKAIDDNEINPWPDGAILGKVIWEQRSDENWEAALVPSSFVHAEFMFKDAKKYKDTHGWGWARWLGTELKPFGEDPSFTQSCIECHLPVKNRDYVFTTPSIFP